MEDEIIKLCQNRKLREFKILMKKNYDNEIFINSCKNFLKNAFLINDFKVIEFFTTFELYIDDNDFHMIVKNASRDVLEIMFRNYDDKALNNIIKILYENGKVDMLKHFISQYPHKFCDGNNDFINIVIKNSDVAIIKILLDNYINVYDDMRKKFIHTAFSIACMRGRNEIMLYIYNNYYTCRSNNELIYTNIMTTYKYRNYDIFKYLFERHGNIIIDYSKLFKKVYMDGNLEIFKYLIEDHVQNNHCYNYKKAFIVSCRCGHIEIVKYLVDKNFIKNTKYIHNAIDKAIVHDKIEIVKYLVNKFPNIDISTFIKKCMKFQN